MMMAEKHVLLAKYTFLEFKFVYYSKEITLAVFVALSFHESYR